MFLKRIWVCGAFALLVSAFAALLPMPGAALAGDAMRLDVDPRPLIVETANGEKRFSIEIADTPAERERGLMFRHDMPDDRGMLFVFERTQEVGFWMKNTPMPLDLAFIGEDGRVRAILPGEPFSEAEISPGEPVQFVLELKAGTADKNGIRPGDLVRHPAIEPAAGSRNPG